MVRRSAAARWLPDPEKRGPPVRRYLLKQLFVRSLRAIVILLASLVAAVLLCEWAVDVYATETDYFKGSIQRGPSSPAAAGLERDRLPLEMAGVDPKSYGRNDSPADPLAGSGDGRRRGARAIAAPGGGL